MELLRRRCLHFQTQSAELLLDFLSATLLGLAVAVLQPIDFGRVAPCAPN